MRMLHTAGLILLVAGAALAYDPVDQVTVTEDGKIRIDLGGNVTEDECIFLSTDAFSIAESRWQVRHASDGDWEDVPDTERTGGACGYVPASPGEYRLVADVLVFGVPQKWASSNTLIVAETAVRARSWASVKSEIR